MMTTIQRAMCDLRDRSALPPACLPVQDCMFYHTPNIETRTMYLLPVSMNHTGADRSFSLTLAWSGTHPPL
eukprot:9474574-Pyramimonas_sp.AAC.1